MMYRAVLFDFDYTLGDSTGPILIGYERGLAALGWPPPDREAVRRTVGMTLADGYTYITGDSDAEHQRIFWQHFQDAVGQPAVERGDLTMIHQTALLPGASELLAALNGAGIPAGIVSTKQRATIEDILAYRGLEGMVALVVGALDVKRPKPDPEGLLWALDRLGVAPGDALFCGDTTIDARTAQAAGTDFCAVLNGTTPAEDFGPWPAVHIAPDLTELTHWLGL